MKTKTFSRMVISAATAFSCWLSLTAYAEPGDIIIIRDVPPQRFTDIRHTGKATTINPSPVRETNTLRDALGAQHGGMTELTDQQFSDITSNVNSVVGPQLSSPLNVDLANQVSGVRGGSAVAGQMGSITGMTSGLGASIGGSVGGATRATGDLIRDALSESLPGR